MRDPSHRRAHAPRSAAQCRRSHSVNLPTPSPHLYPRSPLPPRGSGREPFAPQTVADTAARKWDLNPYPEDVAYGLRAGGAATAASAAALVQRSVQDARARGALGPAREGREAGAGLRDRGAVAGPSGDGADAVMAEAEAEAGVAHVGPMVPGLLAEVRGSKSRVGVRLRLLCRRLMDLCNASCNNHPSLLAGSVPGQCL